MVAFLFLAGAVQKTANPEAGQDLLRLVGAPGWLIWPALAFNAGAGIALLLGRGGIWVPLALAAYCVATSVFHLALGGGWQVSIAVKNWAVAGGLLILAAQTLPGKDFPGT